MEIIEFTAGAPAWFGDIFIPVAVGITVVLIGVGILVWRKVEDLGCYVPLAIFIVWYGTLHFFIAYQGFVTVEEKERLAVEVSEVVGFDVGTGEVDLMLEEKPVRDITYVRDGDTLVIETRGD